MKFSYSAVWADVTALLRSHASLIATVAGVFIFLPGLLTGYFLPQPEPADVSRLGQLWVEYLNSNWHWLLLSALVGMIGSIAILLLIFARGISVGGAIAAAVALLPSYFIASFLSSLAIGFGFVLLIVPGLYLLGRLAPLNAVVVAETHRNPIAAIRRCWALTAGHGWAVFGLILIVALAAAIVVGVATTLIGIVLVLIAGQDIGQLLVLIVRTAGNAAMTTLLLVLFAAIYRQLSEGRSAAAAPAAGAPTADSGDLRCRAGRKEPGEARIGEALEGALHRGEAGIEIGFQGGRMVERAGVDPDPLDSRAPGQRQGPGEQPVAMAHAGELRDEAEEPDQGRTGRPEIELDHPDLDAGPVDHGVDLGDLGPKPFVVHEQPRIPEPARPYPLEEEPVAGGVRVWPAFEPERRGGEGARLRAIGHLEIGDDGADMAFGQRGEGHGVAAMRPGGAGCKRPKGVQARRGGGGSRACRPVRGAPAEAIFPIPPPRSGAAPAALPRNAA